jgi:hypothetical protein
MTDAGVFIFTGVVAPFLVVFAIFIVIKFAAWQTLTLNILRDKGVYPSLSRFQAMLWTLVFAYTILSVIFIDLFTDVETQTNVTNYTTTLLVGALTTAAFGEYLSNTRYQKYNSSSIAVGQTFKDEEDHDLPRDTPRKFITMLMEHDKFSVTRVQLFAWTWIAVFVYVLFYFVDLSAAFAYPKEKIVSLPDIDPNLLALSGISQAGFVAGKAAMDPANQKPDAPAKRALFSVSS